MAGDDMLAALCAVAVLLVPLVLAWLIVRRRPARERTSPNASQEP